MAVQTKVYSQAKPTTTGTQTVTFNPGFEVKGIFAIAISNAVAINTYGNNACISYGFTDMTNHYNICQFEEDNRSSVTTGHFTSNTHLMKFMSDVSGGVTLDETNAKVINPTTTSFQIQFDTNSILAYWYILYCFGDADITNVKVGNKTIPASQALNSTIDYTDTLVTNPVFGMFLSSNLATATTLNPALGQSTNITVGAATTTTNQWYSGMFKDDGNAAGEYRIGQALGNIIFSTTDALANNLKAKLSAWLSGGFQIQITTANDATAKNFGYMLVEGGEWDCNVFNTSAATGNVDTTVAVSSQTPKGLILQSFGAAANAALVSAASYCGGVVDGTSQGSVTTDAIQAAATTGTVGIHSSNNALRRVAANLTNASSTTQLLAAMATTPFAANKFTLNYTTAAAAYQACYIVVADNVAGAAGPTACTVTSAVVTNKFITKL